MPSIFPKDVKPIILNAITHWVEETSGLLDYLLVKKPKIVSINVFELKKYFSIGNDGVYNDLFFSGFQHPDTIDEIQIMFQEVIKNLVGTNYNVTVIFKNLKTLIGLTSIKEITTKSYGTVFCVKGIFRSFTDKLDKIKGHIYRCNACGKQLKKTFTSDYPSKSDMLSMCYFCSSRQIVKEKDLHIDIIRFKIEESSESSEISQKNFPLYGQISEDMVDYFLTCGINVGEMVIVSGYLIQNPTVKNVSVSQFFLQIVNIEKDVEKDIVRNLTKEDEKMILDEVNKGESFHTKLIQSIAPKIEGYEECKLGLIIQELSGTNENKNVWEDPTVRKNKVHLILAGDPAVGKTQLINFMTMVSPKIYKASGDQSTIAGLLGTVHQDELMGGEWTLSIGAMGLANKGTLIIDELNKMESKEISRLNQVLSDYSIHFDKAKVNTTIYTEVKLLGVMNPTIKDSWSKSLNAQKILQLNLKRAFTTRITLIFPFYEDDLKDKVAIESALRRQRTKPEDVYSPEFIKKFFIYAKKKKVEFDTDTLIKHKMNFYETIYEDRIKNNIMVDDNGSPINDGSSDIEKPSKMRVFDNYEAIVSGLARLNITENDKCYPSEVSYEIADILLEKYFLSMFFKSQKKSWDSAGIQIEKVKFTTKSRVSLLMDWVSKKSEPIPFDEVYLHWKESLSGKESEYEFQTMLDRLTNTGDLFCPKNGYYKAI